MSVTKKLSISPAGNHVAVLRHYPNRTQDIQVSILESYINREFEPVKQKYIIEKDNITDLEWVDNRYIIACSSSGLILFYNFTKGKRVSHFATDFGPLNCMKIDRLGKTVVFGSEFGYAAIYSYDVKEEKLFKVSHMTKIVTPISCINISKDGQSIYGGTDGYLVVWNIEKRQVVEKFVVSDDKASVTNILVLKNSDILVTNETGKLTIYECNMFTCKQQIQLSDRGLLCVASNTNETELACGGRDPPIIRLRLFCDKWVMINKIHLHKETVNTLTYIPKKLTILSGGGGSAYCQSILNHREAKGELLKVIVNLDVEFEASLFNKKRNKKLDDQ